MLPKPLKVYLDTSIFNFAISTQDVVEEKKLTLQFLDQIRQGLFLPYISGVVLEEIHKTPGRKREELLHLLGQFALESLPRTDEADILADRYIEAKIIPANERNDALHIAIATIHNLDVIVSWNFEHMVKLKTRREVPAINALMTYKGIEICSPKEVL